MSEQQRGAEPPTEVAAIVDCGFAAWAGSDVDDVVRARFSSDRMVVAGMRHVRIWGIQVDDERELPGHERTQIPDEEIWEIQLVADDGSHYAIDSRLLKPAP